MATYSDIKSIHAVLTTTAEDIVNLTQFWDRIEVENKDGAQLLYVRLDGVAAVTAGNGTEVVGPGDSKMFGPGGINRNGIVGDTTTPPHRISLIGSGNAYSVTGVSGGT